jgi:hypothetical protein
MAYLKNVATISIGNDGSYIVTIDPDCYMDDEDNDIYVDSDDIVFTAKSMEELKGLLEENLSKVKFKSSQEVFDKIKV